MSYRCIQGSNGVRDLVRAKNRHIPTDHTFIHTRYPIEKYVGWAVTSSFFIFDISGVIPNMVYGVHGVSVSL